MSSRRGVSLVLVLSLCALLSSCMAYMVLSAQWAHDSVVAEGRLLGDRAALSALISEGRLWLEGEAAAGRLPRGVDELNPAKFSGVMFHSMERDGAELRVYDLNYGIDKLPAGAFLRSKGAERFFPPHKNMFLLRAFKPDEDGEGVMIEAVFEAVPPDVVGRGWRIENRPILRWEVWP